MTLQHSEDVGFIRLGLAATVDFNFLFQTTEDFEIIIYYVLHHTAWIFILVYQIVEDHGENVKPSTYCQLPATMKNPPV